MPRSYRLTIIAFGLAFVALAVLSQVHAKDTQPSLLDHPADYRHDRKSTPAEDSVVTDTELHIIVGRDPNETSSPEKERWEKELAEAELEAQERMALAAEELAFLTCIQVGIGALGTIALIGTLLLMHRANRVSIKVAEAAAIAARSDIESKTAKLKVTHLAFKSLTQAPAEQSGESEETSVRDTLRYGLLEFSIENGGATDAKLVRVDFGRTLGDLPQTPNYNLRRLFASNEYAGDRDVKKTILLGLNEEETDRIVSTDVPFWVYGRVVYVNYIGHERKLPFCARLLRLGVPQHEGFLFILSGPREYWEEHSANDQNRRGGLFRRLLGVHRKMTG